MATHSSVVAWRIPGIGEPGGLLSMGSHRVGHDWSDLAANTVIFEVRASTYEFWGIMALSIATANPQTEQISRSNHLLKYLLMHVCALSRFCCVRLFVTPWTVAPTRLLYPFHWILQERMLEQAACQPRDWICVSCIGRWDLYLYCHLLLSCFSRVRLCETP